MIFIAGSQPRITKYQLNHTKLCPNCHNYSKWILEKNKQYISLFFIPVIPVQTKYRHYCLICGYTEVLDELTFNKELDDAKPLNT